MIKKSLVYGLIIYLFFCFQDVEAKTIHTILVADSACEVGFGVNLKKIQTELRTIASCMHCPLKEKVFEDKSFQKKQVEQYLINLKVDSSDLVIFYFSGHGYRTAQKINPWPHLNFEFYKPGIDLKWVADTIRSKKPQFVLVIGDCCNNFIERGFTGEGRLIVSNFILKKPCTEAYSRLFKEAKGSIVICSASKGQFAYSSDIGSLFAQSFIASLYRETLEKAPSWKHLLEKTSSYTTRIQKPYYEIQMD